MYKNILRNAKMSEHGSALQTYNQELVKCLEHLKLERNELVEVIRREEAEKMVLEKNIRILEDKLCNLQDRLQHHKKMCDNYDKTISETDMGYKKILESSLALLRSAQNETSKLVTGYDTVTGFLQHVKEDY
ncbi:13 kDa deflagellation-inducible protein-like [Sitophilus oryzae]|uniref:13 kDa deflagellation-inducible protein-like n=1 Tax=Sitophilus oryzae TaxID=7048 RepID=A0A6J2YXF6_SITOR|nr:13 kDa deflagellation-inducible protein-like [Sitophilus oryzae]